MASGASSGRTSDPFQTLGKGPLLEKPNYWNAPEAVLSALLTDAAPDNDGNVVATSGTESEVEQASYACLRL